jgi:hypothetical protein
VEEAKKRLFNFQILSRAGEQKRPTP